MWLGHLISNINIDNPKESKESFYLNIIIATVYHKKNEIDNKNYQIHQLQNTFIM